MDSYAMYLRKSRRDIEAERRGDGETLARHYEILSALAKNMKLAIGDVYREIVSGDTIADRPEMQRMLTDCYAGKYRGVVAVDIDRLSRGNQADAQTILDCLKYGNEGAGLLLVTPTKTYDIVKSPDDEEYLEFELFLSRREYKMIKKRLERGKRQSVLEGNYIGANEPYGYAIVKSGGRRTLVEKPEEAKYVRMIFEWYAAGIQPAEIIDRLLALGVRSPKGNAEWSSPSIREMIANPVYIGKIWWSFGRQTKSFENGSVVTKRGYRELSDKTLFDGIHKPIVSQDLFDAANARRPVPKKHQNIELKNYLSGLIYCADCGRALRYMHRDHQTKKYRYFRHENYVSCEAKSYRAEDVVDSLVETLKRSITDSPIRVDESADLRDLTSEISLIERELTRLNGVKSKLYDAWERGVLDDEELASRRALNEDRVSKLSSQIDELRKKKSACGSRVSFESSVHRAIELLNDDDVSAKDKNTFLKSFISRIELSKTEGSDEFSFRVIFR